jgi:hypothetical protein
MSPDEASTAELGVGAQLGERGLLELAPALRVHVGVV